MVLFWSLGVSDEEIIQKSLLLIWAVTVYFLLHVYEQYLSAVSRSNGSNGHESERVQALELEIKEKERQAEKLMSPDSFVEYARAHRSIATQKRILEQYKREEGSNSAPEGQVGSENKSFLSSLLAPPFQLKDIHSKEIAAMNVGTATDARTVADAGTVAEDIVTRDTPVEKEDDIDKLEQDVKTLAEEVKKQLPETVSKANTFEHSAKELEELEESKKEIRDKEQKLNHDLNVVDVEKRTLRRTTNNRDVQPESTGTVQERPVEIAERRALPATTSQEALQTENKDEKKPDTNNVFKYQSVTLGLVSMLIIALLNFLMN